MITTAPILQRLSRYTTVPGRAQGGGPPRFRASNFRASG